MPQSLTARFLILGRDEREARLAVCTSPLQVVVESLAG